LYDQIKAAEDCGQDRELRRFAIACAKSVRYLRRDIRQPPWAVLKMLFRGEPQLPMMASYWAIKADRYAKASDMPSLAYFAYDCALEAVDAAGHHVDFTRLYNRAFGIIDKR